MNQELYNLEINPLYLISKNGDVYKQTRKGLRSVKVFVDEVGYYRVSLYFGNKKSKKFRVHRLLGETFIPNPDNKPCINHKDGNKLNNELLNLEWATYGENNKHAFDTGLKKPRDQYGIKHPMACPVQQLDKHNRVLRNFDCMADAERFLEIKNGKANIWKCVTNKIPSAYGYKWKRLEKEKNNGTKAI